MERCRLYLPPAAWLALEAYMSANKLSSRSVALEHLIMQTTTSPKGDANDHTNRKR